MKYLLVINILSLTLMLIHSSYIFQLCGYKPLEFIKNVKNHTKLFYFSSIFIIILKIALFYNNFNNIAIIISLIYNTLVITYALMLILSKKKIGVNLTFRLKRLFITEVLLLVTLSICVYFIQWFYISAFIFFTYPIILASNGLIFPIEHKIRKNFIIKAKNKLNTIKPTVIAVTGSYGKTSVKNFIFSVLNSEFKTYATPSSYNTMMGICKSIQEMPCDIQFFIVEMGARRRGDIKKLCELTGVDMAVITGINNQHIETFKSIATTIETKCEMISFLKTDGYGAVINANSDNIREILSYMKMPFKIVTIDKTIKSIAHNINYTGAIAACDIKCDQDGSSFKIEILDSNNKVRDTIDNLKCALLGKHNITNILLAITVALRFNVSADNIKQSILKLKPVEHRLQLIKTNAMNIIDDSYNSNYDGFIQAIDVLKMFSGKKIIATAGLVELGNISYEVNRKLAEKMSSIVDVAIIIGKINRRAFYDGLISSAFSAENIYLVDTLEEAKRVFPRVTEPNCTLLLENDLPDNYE